MKRLNNDGFTLVEVLLILIFLGIIGFTGYYVWHSQKAADKALTVSDNSTGTVAVPATQKHTTKYLDIKEWGVKLPLSSGIESAYYEAGTADVSGSIYLSIDGYKGTDCAADAVTLGAIQRFAPNDKDDEGSYLTAQFPNAVHVGGYYYQYQHPQAGCDGGSQHGSRELNDQEAAKASDLMTEFSKASSNLVAE
jgi:hypothetical protein